MLGALLAGARALGALQPQPVATRSAPSSAAVAVAIDGDTVELPGGQRLRLLYVDAPETGRPLAAEATAHVTAFLARGPVALRPAAPRRDRYGRLLADLILLAGSGGSADPSAGPDSLSASLVSAGLAWVYRGAPSSMLDRQALAVEHRRGVHHGLDGWSGGPLLVTRTGFHALTCTVVGSRGRELPLEATPQGPLKAGRSPCRRCLPWPPRGWSRPHATRH